LSARQGNDVHYCTVFKLETAYAAHRRFFDFAAGPHEKYLKICPFCAIKEKKDEHYTNRWIGIHQTANCPGKTRKTGCFTAAA
jgi:hypothetical protein